MMTLRAKLRKLTRRITQGCTEVPSKVLGYIFQENHFCFLQTEEQL